MVKWNPQLTDCLLHHLLHPEPNRYDEAYNAFYGLLEGQMPRDIRTACHRGLATADSEALAQRDTDDCTSDVMARIATTINMAFGEPVPHGSPEAPLHRLRPEFGFEAWVLGILVPNEVRNYTRRAQRERSRISEYDSDTQDEPKLGDDRE